MGEKDWAEIFGSEWTWIQRLGKAITDPEEKRTFWESIKSRKLANPRYSIYQDFPRDENSTKKAMQACCDYVRSLRHPEKDESNVG